MFWNIQVFSSKCFFEFDYSGSAINPDDDAPLPAWCKSISLRFNGTEWNAEERSNAEKITLRDAVATHIGSHYIARVTSFTRAQITRYELADASAVTIGSSTDNDIIIEDRAVSRRHAAIVSKDGMWWLEDSGSVNGTYLNGERLTERAVIKPGDSFCIAGKVLAYQQGAIFLRNLILDDESFSENRDTPGAAYYPPYIRSPRILPAPVEGAVTVEAPPRMDSKPQISWLSVILPPVAMSLMTVLMYTVILPAVGASYGNNYFFLLSLGMMSVSVLTSILNYRGQKKKHRLGMEKRTSEYLAYLRGLYESLKESSQRQRKLLVRANPNPQDCLKRVADRSRYLWERTRGDLDFLHARIGTGAVPFAMELKLPAREYFAKEADALIQEYEKLPAMFNSVADCPILLSFLNPHVGVIGARRAVLNLVRTALVQLTTHHAVDMMRIIAFYPPAEAALWEWMRFLPHAWDGEKASRYIAKTDAEIHALATSLYDWLQIRRSERGPGRSEQFAGCHYIIFVGNAEQIRNRPLWDLLLENNTDIGVHTVFLGNTIGDLPGVCDQIVNLGQDTFIFNRTSREKQPFLPDSCEAALCDSLARGMAPIYMQDNSAATKIPDKLTFLEMFKAEQCDQIDYLHQYRRNEAWRSLEIPIGVRAGGDAVCLNLHDSADGPHGIIAGTTGSGKSEFLQTLILACAAKYSPEEAAFVLIDYKGGAMAAKFQALPHLAGTITNIDGRAVFRALISIKSEIARRQALLKASGNLAHIDAYQKLRRAGRANEPLPHLLIIADEFAELKANQPEFMKELISTARVGRSLGVHLLLATQKPDGVVDEQIWSNTRFRICFKVGTEADSRNVIKRGDAARITKSGRGYLQVGNDEKYFMFQAAWSGAEYISDPEERKRRKRAKERIGLVALNGKRSYTGGVVYDSLDTISELDAVIGAIASACAKSAIGKTGQLWMPPLPEALYLEDIRESGEAFWLQDARLYAPVTGLVDDPKGQRQFSLKLDLLKLGHTAIFGAPGTGKTTMLQTIGVSLVLDHAPDALNLYIIDFGGRTMGVFRELPHVGEVILGPEDEKIEQLRSMLAMEIERRIDVFSSVGASSLETFQQIGGQEMPMLVLLIDNYPALRAAHDGFAELLVQISREGGSYGIVLVLTADNANSVQYKIMQNIRTKIALALTDKNEYPALVGRTGGLEPEPVAGRGLVRIDTEPLEFQCALCCKGNNEAERIAALRALFDRMRRQWKGGEARAVPVVPKTLTLADLAAGTQSEIPVGIITKTNETSFWNYAEAPHMAVVTGNYAERAAILKCLVSACMASNSIADIVSIGLDEDVVSHDDVQMLLATLRTQARMADAGGGVSPVLIAAGAWKRCYDLMSDEEAIEAARILKSWEHYAVHIAYGADPEQYAHDRDNELITAAIAPLSAGIFKNGSGTSGLAAAFNAPSGAVGKLGGVRENEGCFIGLDKKPYKIILPVTAS